jgi:hypothetical protein
VVCEFICLFVCVCVVCERERERDLDIWRNTKEDTYLLKAIRNVKSTLRLLLSNFLILFVSIAFWENKLECLYLTSIFDFVY